MSKTTAGGASTRLPKWLSRLADRFAVAQPFLFLLPFALFCFLILICPNCRSYSSDEINVAVLTRGGVGQMIETIASEGWSPVYCLVLKSARALVGERLWALRLLSAIFAISAYPFLWALARQMFGKSIAPAAWLLAISSFIIFGSRLISCHALTLLETAVATCLLFLLLEQPTRRLWIAYGAIVALSFYTSFSFLIVMAAHAVAFVAAWRKEPRRLAPPTLIAAIVCLSFGALASLTGWQIGPTAQSAAEARLGGRLLATAAQIAYTPYAFAAGDSISPFALPLSATIALFLALLALLGARKVWENRSIRSLVVPAVVGLALVLPAALRIVGWLSESPIRVAVHLLPISPFLVMILACGLLAIGNRHVRRGALAATIAIQAVALVNYYWNRQWTDWTREVPMPEIVGHVEKNVRPNDLVLFDEWNLGHAPSYYWRGSTAVWRFGPSAVRWPARLNTTRRIWIVRAVADHSPDGQMDLLFSHIQRNFVLKQRNGYVREPPAILGEMRRWLRGEIHPYHVESLLFERPPEYEGIL